MRIAMFTNVYLPHVGGVARSVERFTRGYRSRGHRVLIVAPTFPGSDPAERDVVRLHAIQQFNGGDFSVALPVSIDLHQALDAFKPEIIHSHHPFLVGNTALRAAASRAVPIVFTHHTMYEHYTHYVPLQLDVLRQYVIELSTGYANFCDRVIAPSRSVADVLTRRGVKPPIRVIPTGVDLHEFADGDGEACRKSLGIEPGARVIGHVGRLAPEKNLAYLSLSVAEALKRDRDAHFVVVGSGPSVKDMKEVFTAAGVAGRVHFAGVRRGRQLVDAYHAMNVFAFASKTETQGMVLVEALAAGVPLVALSASGVDDVVTDNINGRLLPGEATQQDFARALCEMLEHSRSTPDAVARRARQSAEPFDTELSVSSTLQLYDEVRSEGRRQRVELDEWATLLRGLRRQWDLWVHQVNSLTQAVTDQQKRPPPRAR